MSYEGVTNYSRPLYLRVICFMTADKQTYECSVGKSGYTVEWFEIFFYEIFIQSTLCHFFVIAYLIFSEFINCTGFRQTFPVFFLSSNSSWCGTSRTKAIFFAPAASSARGYRSSNSVRLLRFNINAFVDTAAFFAVIRYVLDQPLATIATVRPVIIVAAVPTAIISLFLIDSY